MNKTEIRVCLEPISVRFEEDVGNIIEGYAAVFDQRSKLLAEKDKVFFEVIEKGAFDEVLSQDLNVIANVDHDNSRMLARTRSGTLRLEVDDVGLRYIFTIPKTSLGTDIEEQVNRGDIFESSFKFIALVKDAVFKREGSDLVRYISKIKSLLDVSLVVNGAYSNTDVAVRCIEEFEQNEENTRQEELNNYYINLKSKFHD